ncbi:MAG: hypothetical protein EKK37_10490 [Sphingobacteriales bacterium]|nr:MAG: hypothetical protein EKK37_10490 [Sphingobacteriales bacterium]
MLTYANNKTFIMKKTLTFFFLVAVSIIAITGCKKSGGVPAPTITAISPASGIANTAVTITGTNFDATASKNTVKFNGTIATVTSASSTSLVVMAPAAGSTGVVTVTTSGGTATGPAFTYLQPPTITSISPATGIANTVVTISGTNFKTTTTNNVVKFNGVTATVQTATSTSLTVSAPVSTTGTVSVTTSDGTANGPTFTYIPAPTITSINPASGPAGSAVTITGTDFDATAANDIVKFNGVTAAVTSATTTQLVVTAPVTGTTGNVTVTTTGGTSNGMPFTYTTGPDIYLAGLNASGGSGGYWKNNSWVSLTNCGAAFSIYVSGTDVYVSGVDISSLLPAYWKNGTENTLPVTAGVTAGQARSIVVSGTDVYIAGLEGSPGNTAPRLWKNGVSQSLALPVTGGDQRAFAVAISGSDVYVAGNAQPSLATGHQVATIWKNGAATYLTNGDYYSLSSLFINGADIYAAGQNVITSFSNPRYYWKNNTPITLSGTAYRCTGIGVTTSGDVYISGDDGLSPQYWKNGTVTPLLPNPSSASYATGVFIVSNDVYICGNYGGGGSGYWKNGTWNQVNNAQSINAIFVK